MKEGIDVTGIPGPNPMLGCGIILFVVGVVAVIVISGYLLFNASLILQMLFYGIWAIVVGVILIVLCLKYEKYNFCMDLPLGLKIKPISKHKG